MTMKFNGRHLLSVNVGEIWTTLYDPDALRQIIPGCQQLEIINPGEYRVRLDTYIGPEIKNLKGFLKLEELARYADILLVADVESPDGMICCRGTVSIEAQPEGGSAVCHELNIDVGGQLAALAPRLMETSLRSIMRQAQEALAVQVEQRTNGFVAKPDLAAKPRPHPTHPPRLWLWITMLTAIPLAFWFISRILDRLQAQSIVREIVENLWNPGRTGISSN